MFSVVQEISHGDYWSRVAGRGRTLPDAVAAAMYAGPIGYRPEDVPVWSARVARQLEEGGTGHAGWARYSQV
ncbi:hypothetical protein [Streptomyces qinglanensis]|uniref:hypothetical protein n=1 Tax=Streptomyces qinglanensis TaxID=943816 RepID=UPI003D70D460